MSGFCKQIPVVFVILLLLAPATVFPKAAPDIPVAGTVTMVDLGADKCIPCKMMAPILVELRKEYEGKAAIIFLDVWKDPSLGKPFGIRTIPTQIFYDKTGKEVWRHEGFLKKESIVEKLESLLKQ